MRDLRFLLVDVKMMLKLMTNIVSSRLGSSEVFVATKIPAAMEILEAHKVDMIIVDHDVPALNGQTLVQMVRSKPQWQDIPIIMTSTDGEKEIVIEAIRSGVTSFVVKPFSPTTLEDAIRKAWNSAKQRAARRYSNLPKHQVNIDCDNRQITAQILDISRSGMLLKLRYDSAIHLFGHYQMDIDFDEIDELGLINIGPITGAAVRLETAVPLTCSTRECELALAFMVETLTEDVKHNLKELLTCLHEREKQRELG